MQRILVIGSGGAGKSTLSRKMGRCLNIPVVHLDAIFWQPGWVAMNRDKWHLKVQEITREDSWIMDGNYAGSLGMRLSACDTVIFLNLSRWVCMYRMFRRVACFYGRVRPDLARGCPEQLPDWDFIRWIWTFPQVQAPRIQAELDRMSGRRSVIVLRSRADVRRFISSLPDRNKVDPVQVS